MKGKKTGKRIAACLLALIMSLSLAACGGSGKSGQNAGTDSKSGAEAGSPMPKLTIKDGVVKSEQVKINDETFAMDGLQLLGMEDGWFYGLYYSYDEASGEGDEFGSNSLIRFKADGTGLEKINLQGEDAQAEIIASAFRDGCFYLGLATYSNSPALDYALANEGSTEELAIPEELSEDATGSYKIACINADGSPKWSVPVDASAAGDDYYYIAGIAVLEDGIYVSSADRVDKYDRENGSFKENVCSAAEEDLTGAIYVLEDGRIIMTDEYSSTLKVSEYDKSQKKFQEKCVFPSALQGAVLFPGKSCDFYLAGDDGIYGANVGSNELTPTLNYVNSDLDAQGVVKFLETGEDQFVIQVYGSDTSLELYTLVPVAPEDVQEKKELTLGGYYIDFEVRSEVISFNKESSEYRISLVDYSQYDLEDDNYYDSTGLSRMNTDIASGAAPDILLLSEQVPLDSYISKGVFEDLTDRYNSDTGIDKSDFLDNVMGAFLTDGRMYVAVPGFSITGVSGKAKYIGDGKNLNIAGIKKIAAERGLQDADIFGVIDRTTVFQSAIEFSGDQFIDRDSHSCDFNNAQFQELLEFANLFPETISEEQYNDYFTQYLADKAILNIQNINTIYDYNYMTRDLFGDTAVTITGFPSENNKGPAVFAALSLGINSSASDVDGCWSFVRRFYLPEFQMKLEGCLPVSEKAIDAQGQELIDSIREQEEEYQKYMNEQAGTGAVEGTHEPDGTMDAAAGADAPDAAVDLSSTAEAAAGETSAAGGTGEAAPLEESEDLIGIPVAEEDFDGTHEEYEEYLKEFEKDLAASGGTFEAEVLDEEDITGEPAEAGITPSNLPSFGEEDMKTFKEILGGLTYSVNEGNAVWDIISEEAEAYFAGQKSAAEVSDIIQSRVQVYLKENE